MGKKDISEELEKETEELRDEVEEKRKEAGEKLDRLLSRMGMEFCSRCNRKIESRLDWGGKCLEEGCDNLICKDCWIVEGKRYCKEHVKEIAGKEEVGVKKEFFVPEKPEVKPELKLERPIEETKMDRIKGLTLNYTNFMESRFLGEQIDYTPEEFFKKTGFYVKNRDYGNFYLVVYNKWLIFKKEKIGIMVRPLLLIENDMEKTVNDVLGGTEKGLYTIIIFVADSSSADLNTRSFFEEFSRDRVCLYLMDMESGKLYHNKKNKLAENYSSWFEPKEEPKRFMDLLRELGEEITGRLVISADQLSLALGIDKDNAFKILKKCKFLSRVEKTDSFVVKTKER